MSMNRTTTPCPRCLPTTLSMLANIPGRYETFCISKTGQPGPHAWNDREALDLEIARAKQQYPTAYQGPRANPPAPAPTEVVIDPENLKFLSELAKTRITSGADIKGILFEALTTREELEKEVGKLRAAVTTMRKHASGGTPGAIGAGQFIVTVPEWAESDVDDRASSEGKTVQEWLQEQCTDYIENICGQAVERVG